MCDFSFFRLVAIHHCLCRYYPMSKSSKSAEVTEEDDEIEMSIPVKLT